MMLDDQIEALSASFPMVPRAITARLAADAVAWLEDAGDAVTVSAVRRLAGESLGLWLRSSVDTYAR